MSQSPGTIAGSQDWRAPNREPRKSKARQWQEGRSLAGRRRTMRIVWQRMRLAVALVLFFAGAWMLVQLLAFSPAQTPLVVVAPGDYRWPAPPVAFSEEDTRSLASLDRKNISVHNISRHWRSKQTGMQAFEQQLKDLREQACRARAIVIYVNMHGVSGDDGAPFLVPPGASGLAPETWLPVKEILRAIGDTIPSREANVLLVLDSAKFQTNWRTGVLYNAFNESISRVVKESAPGNVAVLTSSSDGQKAWCSPSMQASVFGRHFRDALAGKADEKTSGGDGNGRVSLTELVTYVRANVDTWAIANRNARQQPELHSRSKAAFQISWALPPAARKLPPPETREETTVDLLTLWRKHDELRELSPQEFAPAQWADFQNKLLSLEQLLAAGSGYDKQSRETHRALQKQLAAIYTRWKEDPSPARGARRRIFTGEPSPAWSGAPMYSTAMLRRFNAAPAATLDELHAATTRLQADPSPAALDQALHAWHTTANRQNLPPLKSAVFLQLLAARGETAAWDNSATITQSINTLDLSEQVATPSELAALRWIQPVIDAGDAKRRRAEDCVLNGQQAAVQLSEPLYERARNHYQHAADLTQAVAAATQLRDLAYAELPYLAAWVARPLALGEQPAPVDRQVNHQLLELLQAIRRIETLLADVETKTDLITQAPAITAALVREQQTTAAMLRNLRTQFTRECDALARIESPTAATLRRIDAVLNTPLPRAQRRADLHEKRREFANALYHDARRFNASQVAPEALEMAAGPVHASYLERVANIWTAHPALVLIGSGEAEAEGEDATSATSERELQIRKIAKANAVARRQLASAPVRIRELQKVGASVKENTPQVQLKRLTRAAQIARSGAAMGAPAADANPVQQLHQFQVQQLFIWQARRAGQDCWAVRNRSGQPFFAESAAGYIAAAKSSGNLPPTLQQYAADVQEATGLYQKASTAAMTVKAGNILLLGKQQLPETVVSVQQHAGSTLPPGLATVIATGRDGSPVPGLAVSGGAGDSDAGLIEIQPGASQRFTLAGNSLAGHGPQLNVAAWFRGATFASPFMMQTLGGVKVQYQPHRYKDYSVTLGGDLQRKLSVVFVLDVSHSMSAKTDVETSDGEKMTRLEVASNALMGMLNHLAARDNARVGVRFYGHRAGWTSSKDQPAVVVRQTGYAREVPLTLSPAGDVERVLPLGRFDATHAATIDNLVATLKPWGQTPLYLSIEQAQRDFAREPATSDRRIVVITDGLNFQLTPAAAGKFEAVPPSSIDGIRAAFNQHQAPVHIVGFKLPPGDVEQARRDFGEIATITGGSYTPVDRGEQLIDSLAELLGRGLYDVRDETGRRLTSTSGSQELELGETFTQQVAPTAKKLTVAFEGNRETVQIEGGEALRLVARAGGQIESLRYQQRLPRFIPLQTAGGSGSGYLLGIHRPQQLPAGGAGFMFSVQHENHRFTPRPAEMWIEAAPVTSDGRSAGPKYVFYDVNYEPGKPVPVLSWNAAEWPADATSARVRCWAAPQQVAPTARFSLAECFAAAQATGKEHVLDEPAGASLQISVRGGLQGDPVKVTVVQRHSETAPDIYAMKINLQPGPLQAPGDTKPQRVSRRFDPLHGVATHVFEFNTSQRAAVQGMMVEVTTLDTIKQQALHLPDSVLVDVAGQQGLLKLETARRP